MKEQLPYIPRFIDDAVRSLDSFGPEIALTVTFLLVILSDLFSSRNSRWPFYLTVAGLAAAGMLTVQQIHMHTEHLFAGMLVADHQAALFKLIFLLAGFIFILFMEGNRQYRSHSKGMGDGFSIFLAVLLGLNLMAMSSNLLMIYMSIEMVSIGSYLMVAYISGDKRQAEASVKYVIFGAVCSAVMLYGLSLLYGFTGTLSLDNAQLVNGLSQVPPVVSSFIFLLILTGIGFKLSAVPFHLWSPDVYEGAPTPVTAFLSTAPKAAGFAVLVRFLLPFRSEAQDHLQFNFDAVLSIAAIAGMVVGNFGAIWQKNVKRMLAYSSIGHTGFLLMAVLAWSADGTMALVFYLFVYVLMNMAAFILADEVEKITGTGEIDAYKGMGRQLPSLMICFVVVLVSLTGLPPTAGFTGKFLVFSAAINSYNASNSSLTLLVMVAGALTTVVSLYYYFKIPLFAFLNRNSEFNFTYKINFVSIIVFILTASLVFFLFFPELLTSFM